MFDKYCGMALFNTEKNLEDYMSALMTDITIYGIKVPPKVRKATEGEFEQYHKPYRVLQGNHRAEASKRIGWVSIDCEVVNG